MPAVTCGNYKIVVPSGPLPLPHASGTVDLDGKPVSCGSNAAMDVIRTHSSGLPESQATS